MLINTREGNGEGSFPRMNVSDDKIRETHRERERMRARVENYPPLMVVNDPRVETNRG